MSQIRFYISDDPMKVGNYNNNITSEYSGKKISEIKNDMVVKNNKKLLKTNELILSDTPAMEIMNFCGKYGDPIAKGASYTIMGALISYAAIKLLRKTVFDTRKIKTNFKWEKKFKHGHFGLPKKGEDIGCINPSDSSLVDISETELQEKNIKMLDEGTLR